MPKAGKSFKDEVHTNLRIKGSPVVKRVYQGTYTVAQVKKQVEKLQEKYKDKNFKAMISVIVPEVAEWRSGKAFNLKDKLTLPDDYEWEKSEGFIVYLWRDASTKGGNDDEHNDCFPNSIAKVYDYYRFPKDMKNAELFKRKLGLNRDDKFPFELVPKAEELLKININVTGDYNYTSKNIYKATVNLLLVDGHYTSEILTSGDLLTGIPKKYHKLVVFKIIDEEVHCYDGSEEYAISLTAYKKINSKKFIKEGSGDYTYIETTENANLIEYYNKLSNDVEKVKELSGGKIDLSRSGYLPQNQALKSIHYCVQSLPQGEPINTLEEKWLTIRGGLRYIHDDIILPKCYEYDIRGSYASMLSSSSFTFPMTQGIFSYIEEIPEIVKYGLYRVNIHKSDDYKINCLFKFNDDNIYTHFDINSARLLNLRINLIKDNEANVLLYEKNRANGSIYFGGLVHYLNGLKNKVSEYENENNIATKNTIVKEIMACLYGSLCSHNKKFVSLHKPVNLDGEKNILHISDRVAIYSEIGKLYKFNYARLGCFLTSSCRFKMLKSILHIKEHVYKFITDSITSDIPLENFIKVGENLGEFKADKNNGKSGQILKNGKKTVWIEKHVLMNHI